jgi:hypothetical protein
MKTQPNRRPLPSPALFVAIIALVLAMGGSAVALKGTNSVKSNDIAKGAVRGADIATGAVKAQDLDLIKVDGEIGPFVTASNTAVELGGPSVTVKVSDTGLVAIYARATGQINGGGNNALAQVHLFEPTLLPNSPRILQFDGTTPELRISAPGTGDLDGTPTLTRGGWIVFPVDAGTYTFSLRYSQSGGGSATFQNTGLLVGVVS